jgi:hypothetical protein
METFTLLLVVVTAGCRGTQMLYRFSRPRAELGHVQKENRRMFEWNARQVKKLTFYEIWMVMVGRALIGFGGGAYLERYFPKIIDRLAIPVLALGVVLTLIAGKGYFRQTSH